MGVSIERQRETEQKKYVACYADVDYKMGPERFEDAVNNLKYLAKNFKLTGTANGGRYSLIDVGCGRSEVVRSAISVGYWPVRGVECVDGLCGGIVEKGEITNLLYGDETWDVVTCFDVMEHLPVDDTEVALRELWRIAKKYIIVSISNCQSSKEHVGELHINRRPYDEWDALLKTLWAPATVEKVSQTSISETWRCRK